MKLKDILVVTVHNEQGSVNMNGNNNSYLCVTLL